MKKNYFTPELSMLSISEDDIVRTSISVVSGKGNEGDVVDLTKVI